MSVPKPYPTLLDFVRDAAHRKTMIREACDVIQLQVSMQKGLMGASLKAIYRMARGLAPQQVEQLVDYFFDDFLLALTPFYHEAIDARTPVVEYFDANSARVAEALMAITDQYTQNDTSGPLKTAYNKLRFRVVDRFGESMGALGGLVHANLPDDMKPESH